MNGSDDGVMQFLPKQMLIWLVPDELVGRMIRSLINVNKSDNYGDGKVFVCPVAEVVALPELGESEAVMVEAYVMAHHPGVNYPKFKDQFAAMHFEADILPVLSLYPMPEQKTLEDWEMKLTDIRGKTATATWEDLKKLPKVEEPTPLVCQIFNWSETPLVTGVRLPMLLEAMGMDLSDSRYLSFYSGDGMYFESLPLALARDPRVLVVYGIEGERLPHELAAR